MSSVRYIGKWFHVPCHGIIVRAKCIDIEFESGVGPLFLFISRDGFRFWVDRKEWLTRLIR